MWRGLARYRMACAFFALTAASFPALAAEPVPSGMAGKLIKHYQMQRVPQEGAWFCPTYSSNDQIAGDALPSRYAGHPHSAGNAIVVVETVRDFSAMHRLQTDEVWHFYGGAPISMLLLYPDGHGQKITLGPNVLAGELPQFTVPRGVWQGSAPRGTSGSTYSFGGTQLSPGFDSADFNIGYRNELMHQYPAFSKDINQLTRAEFAVAPAARTGKALPNAQASVFSVEDVPTATLSPGVTLQELVGRVAAKAKSTSVSVARFTLAPGRMSETSLNHQSKEVLLVTDGAGSVHLADKVIPVSRDSTVFIPPGVVHSMEADASTLLTFYAISAPAFSPEDYLAVKP